MKTLKTLFDEMVTYAVNGDPWEHKLEGDGIETIIRKILTCYFAQSGTARTSVRHVLLEGVNGTAKTEIAKRINGALLGPELRALYKLTGLDPMPRISGSPDLTPMDIMGSDILTDVLVGSTVQQRLKFREGKILKHGLVFYADELNRSPPRTQSALLEAMAEGQVTINTAEQGRATETVKLKDFFLIASQNPSYQEGTFSLPEAQLDRFMIKLVMPYTEELEEIICPEKDHRKQCWDAMEEKIQRRTELKLATVAISKRHRRTLAVAVNQILPVKNTSTTNRRFCKAVAYNFLGSSRRTARLLAQPAAAGNRPVNNAQQTTKRRRKYAWKAIKDYEKQLLEERKAQLKEVHDESRRFAKAVLNWSREIDNGRQNRLRSLIANIVYSTWPHKNSRDSISGLEGKQKALRTSNAIFVTATEGIRAGASPRGAGALFDYLCSTIAARTPNGQIDLRRRVVQHLFEEDGLLIDILRHRLVLGAELLLEGHLDGKEIVDRLAKLHRAPFERSL